MSFYLDDFSDDDRQTSSQTCPHCGSASFYNDPVTGALTCSSCYTQSQTATQEELDYDEGIGLAATGGKRTNNLRRRGTGGGGKGRKLRPLAEYDRSKRLPDAESCCLAFQWLLWDASKRVSKLAGIRDDGTSNSNQYIFDAGGSEQHSVMERTVKKIWFAYLQIWTEATEYYSKEYPEMRVSFRDCFLEDIRKGHLMRHLSVTVGKRVEDEILEKMQKRLKEKQYQSYGEDDDNSISCTESGLSSFNDSYGGDEIDYDGEAEPKSRKRKRQPSLTVAQLCKRLFPAKPKCHPNGICQIHPHLAALKVQPSMTLLLAILQLAMTYLKTGVAPHHLTMWVANGQLPHALNGYALLPSNLKERVETVKKFFTRSFVPPAGVVADLTNTLATACGLFGDGLQENTRGTRLQQANATLLNFDVSHLSDIADLSPIKGVDDNSVANADVADKDTHHQKSLYNVPLLAARMVQDFGFDQVVFNNTLALMGVVHNDSRGVMDNEDGGGDIDSQTESRNATGDPAKNNTTPPRLKSASPDKLYTPLHVAAVIVVACKLRPGWESWKIANLHAGTDTSSSDPKQHSRPALFVPWNESQLGLLGNGPTLDHYLGFLEETAFNGVEAPANVTQFFQSLERDTIARPPVQKSLEKMSASTKSTVPHTRAKVTPNIILSGASNPNNPSSLPSSPQGRYNLVNNIGRYTSYQYRTHNNQKVLGLEPYHPHYCRLLEYMCYIIEETNTGKLHSLVEMFEKELLMPLCRQFEETIPQKRSKNKVKRQRVKKAEEPLK